MSYLLDVNLLLACGWLTHRQHKAALEWLERQPAFTTTALTELGFIRVSMTAGFNATFADAQSALAEITSRKRARFIPADQRAAQLPVINAHSDVTDAYLVELARAHSLKLATLDDVLCKRSWAKTIAENPLLTSS